MPLYELDEGGHKKFYRVEREGTRVVLTWGRIGSAGERKVVEHETEAEAQREYDAQIWKRREHGYRLVVNEDVPRDPEAEREKKLARGAPLTTSPRFWFVSKKKGFVWMEVHGATLVTARGKTGEENTAKPTETALASPAAATRERDKLTASLLAEGYALESFGAAPEPPKKKSPKKKALLSNAKLEDAIAESQSEAAWRAYEDWLVASDDPRGEIVLLERSGERAESTIARGRIDPLLWGGRHKNAPVLNATEWRAGHLVSCHYDARDDEALSAIASWSAAPALELLSTLRLDAVDLDPLVAFSRAPFARAIRELAVWCTAPHELDAAILEPFVHLRALTLTAIPRVAYHACLAKLMALEIRPDPQDVISLLEHPFPALKELTIVVREASNAAVLLAQLADASLPALARLRIDAYERRASATRAQTKSLAGGKFAHLESLELPESLLATS